MALSFSEGSIGGDIETVSSRGLRGLLRESSRQPGGTGRGLPREPTGSNGFAIAPSNTAGHHALLLINPHTSFFFRSESSGRARRA
jgi:acyl-homoserine-lactone acylase